MPGNPDGSCPFTRFPVAPTAVFPHSVPFLCLMISPEIFYLHIHGEQRGPYTIPQIDHLLNSGLIAEETLYWREGLEQWQPVTSLVKLRRRANPWLKRLIILGILAVFLLLGQFFGSTALLGWREASQHDYTAQAAYWRARGVVR